ncbi:MAG: DNA polymerase III subunit epsilon, partial [Acinetobacter sp.]
DIKKPETDWLLDDPFGLALLDNDIDDETQPEDDALQHTNHQDLEPSTTVDDISAPSVQNQNIVDATIHPHITITPATREAYGSRQLILDTETTGFYFQNGDRIVEVGAIEMVNRKLTGSSIHIYINPEKPVGESENIHGISDDFLKDKPKYAEIAATLFQYLQGAEIIAHNASFDMNFLNMEFQRAGFPALSEVCAVVDTLAMAKNKHPGQKNSLDALVRRYEIPARDRTFHGALLDAEILADVYLAMTGGQVSLDIDASSMNDSRTTSGTQRVAIELDLPVILPSEEELKAHHEWMEKYLEKNGEPCFFGKPS